MDGKTTFKYIVFYQFLAAVATLLGFAVIGLGVMMGFGESINIVLERAPQDWGDAVDAAQPMTFALMTVVGVIVWQVGKTAALVVTMGKVSAASGGAGGANPEQIESEVMDRVDDRISSVEADVKKHEQHISNASSSGGESSSSDRRSRRRGSAATGDDASSRSSSESASDSGAASSASDSGSSTSESGSGSSGESNRKSNRRASGGSGDDS